MTVTRNIVEVEDITLELVQYTNYYLQWVHIAEWHFKFNLHLMIREALEGCM